MEQKKNLLKKEGNRGITLVALVVTIVVLLILAGITITMLFSDSGIITKAREAAEATKNAQSDTEKGLKNLAEELELRLGEYDWKLNEDGTKVVNKNYPDGIEIGSYVKYDCTPVDGSKKSYISATGKNGADDQEFTTDYYKDKYWRVLGIDDKGQLLLISDESVYIDNKNNNKYELYELTGYENGIEELNTICDLYGHGKGATGGRMLTIEEVNKITGLNGNNIDGNGTKYGAGEIYEYENKVTYYWDGTDIPYYEYTDSKGELKSGKLEDDSYYTGEFGWYIEDTKTWKISRTPKTATETEKEEITTITSTYYDYNASNTDMQTTNPKLYEILFNRGDYWLNSYAVETNIDYAYWGIGCVKGSRVCANDPSSYLIRSNYEISGNRFAVRPVVSLKSNIKLEVDETTSPKNGCTVYNIV